MRQLSLALLLLSTIVQIGCGLLIGNARPVDEKSDSYGVMDLSKDVKDGPDWLKLETPPKDAGSSSAISDVAFQSKKTNSIISLNSACRPGSESDLKRVMNLLLLGISEVSFREEKELVIDELPALQTTVQGKLKGERVKLRAVVVKQHSCTYDMMYVSRPELFADHEAAFSQFVASLRLK